MEFLGNLIIAVVGGFAGGGVSLVGVYWNTRISRWIHQQKQKDAFRLAAIERRLAVHQEAYALSKRILYAIHSDERHATLVECQKWWDTHCLYLGPLVRETLWRAMTDASSYDAEDPNMRRESWPKISGASHAILEAVGLPDLLPGEDNPEALTERKG